MLLHRIFQALMSLKRLYAERDFRLFGVRQQYPLLFGASGQTPPKPLDCAIPQAFLAHADHTCQTLLTEPVSSTRTVQRKRSGSEETLTHHATVFRVSCRLEAEGILRDAPTPSHGVQTTSVRWCEKA